MIRFYTLFDNTYFLYSFIFDIFRVDIYGNHTKIDT